MYTNNDMHYYLTKCEIICYYVLKKIIIFCIFPFVICNLMFKMLKCQSCELILKLTMEYMKFFFIFLKLRRVMKRKNNNLDKSYLNLHENMKENINIFVKGDIFEYNFH